MLLKLEKKFGKYAVPNLMRYVVVVYALGFIVNMISPNFYYDYLMLDIDMLLKGQVWRLITFIIQPMDDNLFLMLLLLVEGGGDSARNAPSLKLGAYKCLDVY